MKFENTMKKILFALCTVLLATNMVAQMGSSCYDPIPVNDQYWGRVDAPCDRWYTAYTFDLPLTVYFEPDVANSTAAPLVVVDFTCMPGQYEDKKLEEVLNTATDLGFEVPVKMTCDELIRNGKKVYELNIGSNYREALMKEGITYNLQAFVHVTFAEAGTISLQPDMLFKDCIQKSHYIQLNDTIDVQPNDSATTFVIPLPDWKHLDSIRFVWEGDQPARIWQANSTCEFQPTSNNVYVTSTFDVAQDMPYKMYRKDIHDAIGKSNLGGLYYAKVLSTSSGRLLVEKIPMDPPAGGAILLEYDQMVQLKANDSQLYAIPMSWKNATQFVFSGTTKNIQMEISNNHTFEATANNAYVNTYTATTMNGVTAVTLSKSEMSMLSSKILKNYLYVRFYNSDKVSVLPTQWEVSDCLNNTTSLPFNTLISVPKLTTPTVYRIAYAELENATLGLQWVKGSGRNNITITMNGSCDFSSSSQIMSKKFSSSDSIAYDLNTVASWKEYVDADGYVYMTFSPSKAGSEIALWRTQLTSPAAPSSPCVASSIELKSGDQLTLNLDSAFTIYRIEYAAWKEQGMSFSWTGASDLHTFVAETCTFAVAPYNKYVHVYVPVQGEHMLDANAMADLAEYVDEDGYLYIRFLTEKEGVLTVK